MNHHEKAKEIVGARPAELAKWAHDAKVKLIETALQEAYEAGARTKNAKKANPSNPLTPYDHFLQQGLLLLAAQAIYDDGVENPFAKWKSGTKAVEDLWDALTPEEQQKANDGLPVIKTGGTFDLPVTLGGSMPVRVNLAPLSDRYPLDWRWRFKPTVVCKVCKVFLALEEDLPVECPTCDRTLNDR